MQRHRRVSAGIAVIAAMVAANALLTSVVSLSAGWLLSSVTTLSSRCISTCRLIGQVRKQQIADACLSFVFDNRVKNISVFSVISQRSMILTEPLHCVFAGSGVAAFPADRICHMLITGQVCHIVEVKRGFESGQGVSSVNRQSESVEIIRADCFRFSAIGCSVGGASDNLAHFQFDAAKPKRSAVSQFVMKGGIALCVAQRQRPDQGFQLVLRNAVEIHREDECTVCGKLHGGVAVGLFTGAEDGLLDFFF